MATGWLHEPNFCRFARIKSELLTLITTHMTHVMGTDFMRQYVMSPGTPDAEYNMEYAIAIRNILSVKNFSKIYENQWDNKIHQWAVENGLPIQGAISFNSEDPAKKGGVTSHDAISSNSEGHVKKEDTLIPLGKFSREVGIDLNLIRNWAGKLRVLAIQAGKEPREYIVRKGNRAFITSYGQAALCSKDAYEKERKTFEPNHDGWLTHREFMEQLKPFELSRYYRDIIITELGRHIGKQKISTLIVQDASKQAVNKYSPVLLEIVKGICETRERDDSHNWPDAVKSWVNSEKTKLRLGSDTEFAGLFDSPGSAVGL